LTGLFLLTLSFRFLLLAFLPGSTSPVMASVTW
jgi:hypothetical protein